MRLLELLNTRFQDILAESKQHGKTKDKVQPHSEKHKINIAIDLTGLKLVNDGGEYVFSRKSGNVEKEIIAKTNLLNFYINSQTELIGKIVSIE